MAYRRLEGGDGRGWLLLSRGLLAKGDFSFASVEHAARDLLGLDEPATAIIASNDQMALAGLDVALTLGRPSSASADRAFLGPGNAVDQPIAVISRAVELIIDAQRGTGLPDSRWWCRRRWFGPESRAGARVTPPVKAVPADAGSRFLWLFALAWAGGAVAYVPFLRVVAIAGADSVRLLGLITFFAALAASFGNVLFGWLSDRSADRRPGLLWPLDQPRAAGLGPVGRDPVSAPRSSPGRERPAR